MTDLNGTSDDAHIDLLIDWAVARRAAGGAPDDQALAGLSPDAAVIVELCRLSEIDWPADEVAGRIAANVAAAAGRDMSTGHGTTSGAGLSGQRPRARRSHQWSGKSRWLAAAAAAAVLVAVGVVHFIGQPGAPARHSSAPKTTQPATSPAATPAPAPPAWLTAMRIVSRPGSLTSIGTASISNNFLTCVTRSVCYTLGSLRGGAGDIAHSVNGGATWSSGAPLPSANGQFDSQVKASCPRALTCFLPWGTDLLATTDGFAHFQLLPVTMPSGAAAQVSMVSCPTTQHCVAAVNLSSSSQPFIYSDNGGVSWAAASSPPVSIDDIVGGLRCSPGGACLAAVLVGTEENPLVAAISSTDGGRSWTMSPTKSIVSMQQYMVSCADGRDCVVASNDGYLAWMKADQGGHISIRIQAPPSSLTANQAPDTMTVDNLSCATGNDCFLDTGGAQLAATRDGGLTWTSSPVDPNLPEDNAVYLSCPVAAGCIALANDGSGNQSSWAVLSNLRNGG